MKISKNLYNLEYFFSIFFASASVIYQIPFSLNFPTCSHSFKLLALVVVIIDWLSV